MKELEFSTSFLEILGLSSQPPSVAYLSELAQHHLDVVAYENLSKLDRFAKGQLTLPTPEEYLHDLRFNGLGGTCFTINSFFCQLLRALGFEADLIGGLSHEGKRSHLSLRVKIESIFYALDLGYMLPNPGPFSLDGPEISMPSGARVYKVSPLSDRLFRIELRRGDVIGRSFESSLEKQTLADFANSIRGSFGSSELFMKTLCVHRRFKDHFRTVWGNEYIKCNGTKFEMRHIANRDDLAQILKCDLGVTDFRIEHALAVIATNLGSELL